MIKLSSWKEEYVSVTWKTNLLLDLIISVLIKFIAVLMWFSKRPLFKNSNRKYAILVLYLCNTFNVKYLFCFLLILEKSLIGQSCFIFLNKKVLIITEVLIITDTQHSDFVMTNLVDDMPRTCNRRNFTL